MRRLLLALEFAVLAVQAFAQADNGIIEGKVVNAVNHEPLPGVQITLTADAMAQLSNQIADLIESGNRLGADQDYIDKVIATIGQRNAGASVGRQTNVLTDSTGSFAFKDLGPGRYNIRASRDGYFGLPINGTAPAAVSKNATVEAGKAAAPLELSMTPGGIISGRIRDPNGQPASGITVLTYRVTYVNGRKTWSAWMTKTTDDRGEYRIFWLPPGEYYVGVTPRAPGTVLGPQDSWARTFYPGVAEPEGASLLSLRKGGELPGIDINIRLATTSVFKVSGVAKNPYARPDATTGAVDQSLSAFILSPREPGLLDAVNPPSVTVTNAIPTNARPNGEFEIRNVRPGSYDLYPFYLDNPPTPTPAAGAPAQPSPKPRYMISRTPVEVRNGDVHGLTITVDPGVTLSGEVVVAGSSGQTVKLESLRVGIRNLGTMPQTFSSVVGQLPVDAAGKFSAINVPQERYAFTLTGLPETAYVADVRSGGASVYDSGFTLDANANPVQILIDSGGAQVEGTVVNAERKPAAGATVVLVPPAVRRENSALFRNSTSDESGHFTLKGVPPGQYTMYAWESVLPGAWLNADFLGKYDGRGRPLLVEGQSNPQIQIDVIPLETEGH